MKYKLTVLLSAIRQDRWVGVYESIKKAFSGTWELIIVTDRPIPPELSQKENIRWIYSQRSPIQKQQEGLCQAKGEWVTWMSDDSLWEPNALDEIFKNIKGLNYKQFLVMKYLEGPEFYFPPEHYKRWGYRTNYDFMKSDAYYMCRTHDSSNFPFVPKNTPIISISLVSLRVLKEIGGWDCIFQTLAIGNDDLSIRLIKHGCSYEIIDLVAQTCGWMPNTKGDHSAVHYAQIEDDQPLLAKMYSTNECKDRIVIPLDNWKQSDAVWKRLNLKESY